MMDITEAPAQRRQLGIELLRTDYPITFDGESFWKDGRKCLVGTSYSDFHSSELISSDGAERMIALSKAVLARLAELNPDLSRVAATLPAIKEENMPTYPYKPKTTPAIIGFSLFAALTAASVNLALNNDRGLIINKIIHVNSSSANVLLVLITALFAGMAIVSLLTLKNSFSSSRWIELNNDLLSIPKSSYSNSITSIKTTHIKSLSLQQVQKHQILKIAHKHGSTIMHSAMFPDAATFERMCESIQKASKING